VFEVSSFYRQDSWIGRYCAHPLTAWTHLLAAAGMVVLLQQSPAVDIGWAWLLFFLVPGVWLFITGMFFGMRAMARLLKHPAAEFLSNGESGWAGLLLSRESASFFMMFVLLWFILAWQQARPFDQEDFRRCARGLEPAAQVVLADKAKTGMPRTEFWTACAQARRANAPKPSSLEELQARQR
jgi:hypothetical protein